MPRNGARSVTRPRNPVVRYRFRSDETVLRSAVTARPRSDAVRTSIVRQSAMLLDQLAFSLEPVQPIIAVSAAAREEDLVRARLDPLFWN